MILKVKNKKVDYFNDVNVNLVYDSIADVFSFAGIFDPENADHKEFARPGAYHKAEVEHNGETLITGTLLSPTFSYSSVEEYATFSGYSTPGVLEDCEIPISLYPLQSNGLSLVQITRKLIKPFGINLVIDPAISKKANSVFNVSTANERQSIKSYLQELASQKNIILSHDERGNLLLTEAKINKKPILELTSGIPAIKMSLGFNGQAMHSTITLQKQASLDGGNASESTIRNPYARGFRPKVKNQTSGTDNDTKEAASHALSEELKGITLSVELDRWDVGGKIIRPNNIITVKNPKLYLYKETPWFIQSVSLFGNEKEQKATLNCVPREVFNSGSVKNIFE